AGALLAASIGTKRSGSTAGWAGDVVLNAALVAASANLVNLLDLRPGRALKASLAVAAGAGAAGVSRGTAGAVAGAAGMALAATSPSETCSETGARTPSGLRSAPRSHSERRDAHASPPQASLSG